MRAAWLVSLLVVLMLWVGRAQLPEITGVAGDASALTALVVTTLPSTAARLTYLVVFGLGSTLGMAALSGLLGWPLAHAGRHRALARSVSLAVGCVSTALGLAWGYPVIGRLF